MASIDNHPLLTIGIPTYNRAKYLDRSLSFLYTQLKDGNYPIELIVSDNCSTDNTVDIVGKYIQQGLVLRFIRNAENKGADFNVAQCYREAQGRYVLALGDDDILLDGALAILVEILNRERQYGVIYMNSVPYDGQKKINAGKLRTIAYDDPVKFIRKVNFFVTFISGNIVNREFIDSERLSKNFGSYLNHVPLILESILKSDANLYVEDVLLVSEQDNSGGYNLFKIFGENFNHLIDNLDGIDKDKLAKIKRIINVRLLMNFFPLYILKLKKSEHNFSKSTNPVVELRSVYKRYFSYWFVCLPVGVLPYNVGYVYFRLINKLAFIIS